MRDSSNIVDMIADAQRQAEELKEIQFFGADALTVNTWTTTASNSSDSYLLTLKPDTAGTVLPMQPECRWVYNGTYGAAFEGAIVHPRYTNDGSFQWEVTFMTTSEEITSASIHLSWIGDAKVTWSKK